MIVKLLTEHALEFLSLKGGCREARPSLHMSKCHVVGNLMHWLIYPTHFHYVNLNFLREIRCGIHCVENLDWQPFLLTLGLHTCL